MPEHRIRLRGAWDWHGIEGEAEFARRADLPADWPDDLAGPLRLLRRFSRPPLDPGREAARLELANVPGLVAVRLNGVDLGPVPAGDRDWIIPLGDGLLPRNSLVLEVDLPPGPEARRGWGSIALVISAKV